MKFHTLTVNDLCLCRFFVLMILFSVSVWRYRIDVNENMSMGSWEVLKGVEVSL